MVSSASSEPMERTFNNEVIQLAGIRVPTIRLSFFNFKRTTWKIEKKKIVRISNLTNYFTKNSNNFNDPKKLHFKDKPASERFGLWDLFRDSKHLLLGSKQIKQILSRHCNSFYDVQLHNFHQKSQFYNCHSNKHVSIY